MGKNKRARKWQSVSMKQYRVAPKSKVELDDFDKWDPDDNAQFGVSKSQAEGLLREMNARLEALQELLYAEGKHRVLIVLQAMDTGGKDGVIRHVFEGVNPAGVNVASFKVPNSEELAHDYLWRIHKQTPGRGQMVIFNRSHYEDVLVVRVEKLVPDEVWKRRYDQINDFEQMLAEEGTLILKFYLHIDLDEQAQRLQARLDDPTKHWKFALGDLETRAKWPAYIEAYEDAISRTSTEWAPWYIIPANRKWYRNLVISKVLIDALEGLQMRYPEAEAGLDKVVIV